MKQCECGSRQFNVWATSYGEMCIEISGEDCLEVVHFDPFESDFDRREPVECVECGRSIPCSEWDEPSGRSVEGDALRV